MIELSPDQIAAACGAEVTRAGGGGRPARAVIDSRELRPGDLFFGLRGERTDGGAHAEAALVAGAWGVVVEPERAAGLADGAGEGWVFAAPDPLRAMQRLAREWRRTLACPVVGITGSTGKTSVKDITRALLPFRVHASAENFNTEIGLPLTVLEAPPETEVLVLEMAMRGLGQIAELCEIAEPDVAAITNVGPVHLELLGTLEAIAEAKAEILGGLGPEGHAVVPVDAEALAPHLRDEIATITFGPGGEVFSPASRRLDGKLEASIAAPSGEALFTLPFTEEYNLTNTLCAVAIGSALGASVEQLAARTSEIAFSRLRGELVELPGGSRLINDCYNANPVSMRAALDHLASLTVRGRRIAVLGGMAELGPEGPGFHREAGAHARELGLDLLIGVGELARDYAPDEWVAEPEQAAAALERELGEGDVVLVKGSRAIGLEALSAKLVS